MKNLVRILAMLTLSIGALVAFPGSGSAAGYFDHNVPARIVNLNSSKCLNVKDWGTTRETPIQQWSCSRDTNNVWKSFEVGPSQYSFFPESANWCFGTPDSNPSADGAPIRLEPCGASNNTWSIRPYASGLYQIVNLFSGKCLNVQNWSTANGAALVQWTCSGDANNLFYFEP